MTTSMAVAEGLAPIVERFWTTGPGEFRQQIGELLDERAQVLHQMTGVITAAVEAETLTPLEAVRLVTWNAAQLYGYGQLHDPEAARILASFTNGGRNT